MRVFQLAATLDVSPSYLCRLSTQLGLAVANHMSELTPTDATRIQQAVDSADPDERKHEAGNGRPSLCHFCTESTLRNWKLTHRPVIDAMYRPRKYTWDVFISHAAEDSDFARAARRELEARGWRPFLAPEDLDVEAGSNAWSQVLEGALQSSGGLLLLASRDALRSRWVEYEWSSHHKEVIAGTGKRLVPLCIRSVKRVDLPYALRRYQAIDLEEHESLRSAIERVCRLLRGPTRSA